MTTAEKMASLLAWAETRKPPSQAALPVSNQIAYLSDMITYLDRMLAKHADIQNIPCERAARLFDPYFRAGIEHDGHWVIEPDATHRLMDETWKAAVAELRKQVEPILKGELCRM